MPGLVCVVALTSAPSCVSRRSCAPASPNVWGKTGIWSCNLQDASRGRNPRSQLVGRREEKRNNAKLNVKHIHTQSEKIKLEDADVICSSVPEIISLPSCYTALPRMTLMLIPLCEKELTRQPIFNSSAPPSEDVCLFPNT